MARACLPPGFRFHPTDVELVLYYLKRKVLGKPLLINAVTELDLYKFAPWDLPGKSLLQGRDLEWYFFCPRDKKYSSGPRMNRATKVGYWKATGRDRTICNGKQTVGIKKTLIFHVGKAREGTRTNWVMHEYKLEIKDWIDPSISQDSYVLCKIFEKSGAGPKNGEQHGAPFTEEEWEADVVDGSLLVLPSVDTGSSSTILADNENLATEDSTLDLGNTGGLALHPIHQNPSSDSSGQRPSLLDGADMDDLFANIGEGSELCFIGNNSNEITYEGSVDISPPSDGNDIFGGLEDLDSRGKLKGIGNLHLVGNEDNFALGRTVLGDDVAYMELDDLNCPMAYRNIGSGPELVQCNKFMRRLEVDSSDKLGPCDRHLSQKDAAYMELGDLSNRSQLLGNSANVPSGDQFVCNNYKSVEGFPIPFVQRAYNVGSTGCMLPRNLADNLEMTPSLFQDHTGFEGTVLECGNVNQALEVLSSGEGINANISQTLDRGSSFQFSW